jgi:hypothetical protein
MEMKRRGHLYLAVDNTRAFPTNTPPARAKKAVPVAQAIPSEWLQYWQEMLWLLLCAPFYGLATAWRSGVNLGRVFLRGVWRFALGLVGISLLAAAIYAGLYLLRLLRR